MLQLAASKEPLRVWEMEIKDAACLTEPCPDPQSKDWKRLQKLCCPQGGHFHCQSNDLEITKRVCMEPVVCPAGRICSFLAYEVCWFVPNSAWVSLLFFHVVKFTQISLACWFLWLVWMRRSANVCGVTFNCNKLSCTKRPLESSAI